jgi:ABC-type sulfate/molybdate transport systems ATPase subunit
MTQSLVGLGLEFAYAGRDVVRGATVAVAPGRVTAIVGPSGSGKSTLLWLLAGLLEPKAGRIVLAESVEAAAKGEPVDFARARLGMVFQSSALWEHLTVEEHLGLVLAGKGFDREDRRRRTNETLARLRLEALRRRRPGQLSGGEARRLAIARAIVADPEWLLLDEPLVHLDGPTRAELFATLRDILAPARAGVLMATHDAHEAMRLAGEIVVLAGGEVAQRGPPDEVYRRPVNLGVAQMLGPASELSGEARGGVLTRGGRAVLENLPAEMAGPQRLLLRPEDVAFRPAAGGAVTVRRCEFDGAALLVTLDAAGEEVTARQSEKIAAGEAGCLRLLTAPAAKPPDDPR